MKAKKSFLRHQIYHLVTHFTIFIVSFCLVPSLTLVSQFIFPSYYFFHHFYWYSLYYFIVNARETTNFTIYILRIDMSPTIKNNFKHLFIIYCLSNTNKIFTKSVCKHFVVNLVVWIYYFFKFILILWNIFIFLQLFIYFVIIILIFFRSISL